MADPSPVVQTFFLDDDLSDQLALDAVVTVVDAHHLPGLMASSREAMNQVAFADLILLNKVDLVTPAQATALEQKLVGINPSVTVHRTERCNVRLDAILGRGAFALDRALELESDFLRPDQLGHHRHDDDVASVALRSERLVDPDAFMLWMQQLVKEKGVDLLRSKGILAFTNEHRRFVFLGVQAMLDGDVQREWGATSRASAASSSLGASSMPWPCALASRHVSLAARAPERAAAGRGLRWEFVHSFVAAR